MVPKNFPVNLSHQNAVQIRVEAGLSSSSKALGGSIGDSGISSPQEKQGFPFHLSYHQSPALSHVA